MELLYGIVCGLLIIVPGWGLALSLIVASAVPGSEQFALISGLLFSSYKESYITNSSGGNAYLLSGVELKTDPRELCKTLLNSKAIVMIVSLVIGIYMPPIIGTSKLLSIIIAFYLIARIKTTTGIGGAIIWVTIINILVSVWLVHITTMPITILGVMIFSIPQALQGIQLNLGNDQENNTHLTVDYGSIGLASAVSLATPGISPHAICQLGSPNSTLILKNYVSIAALEGVIEAFSLAQVSRYGEGSSRALAPLFCGTVNPLKCIACIIIVVLILKNILVQYNIYNIEEYSLKYIALGVSVIYLVVEIGLLLGLGVIIVGIILSSILSKIVPPSAYGLTYITLI